MHLTAAKIVCIVEQEWKTYFDNGREEKIDDGWRGVVKLNQSIIDPAAAFAFFSAPDFEKHHLAPGQSRSTFDLLDTANDMLIAS